jgi:hypothetical protein
MTVAFVSLWSTLLEAKPRATNPYDIVDASHLPYTIDLESTVKLLPKALRPAGKAPHRCLVLQVEWRPPTDVFAAIYFDRFSLSFDLGGIGATVPAVGVGMGPLPLQIGDPEEKWADRWEIGKAEGNLLVQGAGGNPPRTSKIKVLFLVPKDVTEVTLLQKDAGGKPTVVKAGIRITE